MHFKDDPPPLDGLTTLQHLRLIQDNTFGAVHLVFLDALEITSDATIVPLPALAELEIEGSPNYQAEAEYWWDRETEEDIERVVKSRIEVSAMKGAAAIQRLTIRTSAATFSDPFLDWLFQLEGHGVQVSFADSKQMFNIAPESCQVAEEDF